MELKDSFVGHLHGQKFYREYKTDAYVEVPPALIITDERGDVWSLGNNYTQVAHRFFWNVIRNDREVGEQAERIVFRNGKVKIYCHDGWKTWTGNTFI